jgi:hypothetical protein
VALDPVSQRLAFDELHRDPRHVALGAIGEDARDAGVPEPPQRLDLAPERGVPALADALQDLQRDAPAGIGRERLPDDAGRAGSDLSLRLEAAVARRGRQDGARVSAKALIRL